MMVVDLFCGMGGLSYGFAQIDFNVVGYDVNPFSPEIYELNALGKVKKRDLSQKGIDETKPEIIIGGPPCKPWSSVNLIRRGNKHPDHTLLKQFFRIIYKIQPPVFLMENVLPIRKDDIYLKYLSELKHIYNVGNTVVKYSDYGGASKRRRLITAGFKTGSFNQFLNKLEAYRKPPMTVGEKIKKFETLSENEYYDHQWPHFTTIRKYKKYYESGKYGWYRLDYNSQAPSFGNIMKTYILHPKADIFGNSDEWLRVLSVREVMSIMGFPDDFIFPEKMGHTVKYQMVADTVSPDFSIACAKAIRDHLIEND